MEKKQLPQSYQSLPVMPTVIWSENHHRQLLIFWLVLVGCNSISEFTKLIWDQNLISKRWNLYKAESIFIFLQNEREM